MSPKLKLCSDNGDGFLDGVRCLFCLVAAALSLLAKVR